MKKLILKMYVTPTVVRLDISLGIIKENYNRQAFYKKNYRHFLTYYYNL